MSNFAKDHDFKDRWPNIFWGLLIVAILLLYGGLAWAFIAREPLALAASLIGVAIAEATRGLE